MEKVARPFRVCLTGAESTGKSELSEELARHFSALWVQEYSRHYASAVQRELSYMDVTPIAKGQIELEDSMAAQKTDLLILDTDLISTIVYSRHHFGACPQWIERAARNRRADLYLLLDIDVPWVADPVRDCGDTRMELHEEFRSVLEEFGAKYVVISGTWDERLRRAVAAIECAGS
jgi:NadR type nicotinamide-nucleotide adenylyltransferase